jgi:hypothetical protein
VLKTPAINIETKSNIATKSYYIFNIKHQICLIAYSLKSIKRVKFVQINSKNNLFSVVYSFLILLSLSLLSQIAYANVEDTCIPYGQSKCINPTSPKASPNWMFYVVAGEWGDIWGTGSTANAAIAAANAYSKSVPPFLAGPTPALDCTNCDAMGRGSTSVYVGMTGSNLYNSAGPVYSTANFEGFLPQSENIPYSVSTLIT